MTITINEIKNNYKILLHKTNEEVIGELPFSVLESVSNSMNECGQIKIIVNKYYIFQIDKKYKQYILYDELKNERLISLDREMYVIRDVDEDEINEIKTITAYSLEKKLEKINISVEDLGFYLQDSDEGNNIYSLDDYMYEETGWRFGHIDNVVKYNEDNTHKMRWQENIDTQWLDFLNKNVSTQFNCYVHYDNKNKLINLYDMASFGDDLKIILSYDNYIKSLEKSSLSSDIITKLKLVGNEDSCIVSEENPSGKDYIEDYSYFIENNEMSQELIDALNKYDEITAMRSETWKILRDNKITYQSDLMDKKKQEKVVLADITVLNKAFKDYSDKIGTKDDITGAFTQLASETAAKIEKCEHQRNDLYNDIQKLEQKLELTDESIRDINILCQKETATDENGSLIFTQKLLDELKLFIYSDTFTDDSYYVAKELIDYGKKHLSIICRPTTEWNIDVLDFTERLISNNFRKQWNGTLGLGDVIGMHNSKTDTETFIYLVGYEKNYKDKSLNLTLSNKKESNDVIEYINEYLKLAKQSNKLMIRTRRLLNAQKYNRINLDKSEVK